MTLKWSEGAGAARVLAGADPLLGRLIERVGPCRLELDSIQSPFAALAEAIVYQQLNGRAARIIHGRFLALFRPKRVPSPDRVLSIPHDALRAAGLSRAKIAALKDLAARTNDGTVPSLRDLRRMDEDEIVQRLTQVRGIGRWTVEMLLIFRLGRPDVLPAADYGIRKGFARAFRTRGLPTPKQVLRRGERWRPHRTMASWYLWRAAEPGVVARPSS
ncbi:MAG TPA: DNA-3-methyladenine glycosylase 2 family protein [Candidatus Polarisedimenticolia bacterium]|nr:DNA-3-methyladenine glycosylase 2 family protein [Candidatus Polarisedimenticolia bacterium]